MSEKDIVEAKRKRDEKEVRRGGSGETGKSIFPKGVKTNKERSIGHEKEDAEREIAVTVVLSYCSVVYHWEP